MYTAIAAHSRIWDFITHNFIQLSLNSYTDKNSNWLTETAKTFTIFSWVLHTISGTFLQRSVCGWQEKYVCVLSYIWLDPVLQVIPVVCCYIKYRRIYIDKWYKKRYRSTILTYPLFCIAFVVQRCQKDAALYIKIFALTNYTDCNWHQPGCS